MKTLIQQLGVKTEISANAYSFHTTAKDIFTLYSKIEPKDCAKNGESLARYQEENFSSFSGSDRKSFVEAGEGNGIDLAAFIEAKENLKDFSQNLSAELAPVSAQRKRRFSEHDGEFSLDRLWETQPFQESYKVKTGLAPTMILEIDFNFSSGHRAGDITRYGAFCWAIFSKLEEAGISCEVNIKQRLNGLITSGKMKGKDVFFYTNIKKAGEYIDESAVARCFTAAFYRRGCFTFWVACAEANDCKANRSLGYVGSIPFAVSPGKITLTINNQADKPEKLCADILKALKGSV